MFIDIGKSQVLSLSPILDNNLWHWIKYQHRFLIDYFSICFSDGLWSWVGFCFYWNVFIPKSFFFIIQVLINSTHVRVSLVTINLSVCYLLLSFSIIRVSFLLILFFSINMFVQVRIAIYNKDAKINKFLCKFICQLAITNLLLS